MMSRSRRFPFFFPITLLFLASAAAQEPEKREPAAVDSVVVLEKSLIKARRSDRTRYVSKMPMDRMEIPQVYNTVDSKTLKEQVVTRYDEALRNVTGLDRLWESTGRAGDGAAYFTIRGFDAQPNMTNGVPGLTQGDLDPVNLERIEVMKGPSGTLFGGGMVTYGGLINNITKKPGKGRFGEAGLSIGSFGLARLTTDANLPLSAEQDIVLRITTAAHSQNSFQDAGFRKSLFLAPTLAYQASDRMSFLLSAEHMTSEATNPVMLFPNRSRTTDWADLDELDYNRKLSLTSNDISMKNPRFNLQGRMDFAFSPAWTSETILSRGSARSEGYYTYLWNEDPGTFGLFASDMQSETITTDVQQNFSGDFALGSMRNRVLLGLDYFERNAIDNGTGWAWIHDVDARGNIDYVDPWSRDTVPARPLNRQTVDSLLASLPPSQSNVLSRTYSAYASELLDITPAIAVSASLRLDYFDTKGEISDEEDGYEQMALSPKAGLVLQPVRGRLALFGSYLNGFKNIAPAKVSDADGGNPRTKAFEPEKADQFEAGLKTNFFGGRLAATFSAYYIRVSNTVMPDGSNPNNSIQGGEVESRGVELDLNAAPAPGLTLIGGYGFNDIEVVKAAEGDIWAVPGRRPIGAGPEHTANAWANYRRGYGPLKGFGIGAGFNIFSRLLILDSPATGTFALPGTAVMNAAISYAVGGSTLALAVNNLTDEEYYKGYSTINPQMPRNVAADFTFGF